MQEEVYIYPSFSKIYINSFLKLSWKSLCCLVEDIWSLTWNHFLSDTLIFPDLSIAETLSVPLTRFTRFTRFQHCTSDPAVVLLPRSPQSKDFFPPGSSCLLPWLQVTQEPKPLQHLNHTGTVLMISQVFFKWISFSKQYTKSWMGLIKYSVLCRQIRGHGLRVESYLPTTSKDAHMPMSINMENMSFAN